MKRKVIKPADKGSAVVVWRKDLYTQEAKRQLENEHFYVATPSKTTTKDNQTVKKLVTSFVKNGDLSSDALSLLPKEPREPKFYMLPKIHKLNTPGRPIVSACSCPTELISEFVDSVLQPLVAKLPSYVKDTNDALSLLDSFEFPADNTENRYIFTMDVSSLYTNIPHNDGLLAIKHFLPKSNVRVNHRVVLRLAELVLTLASFQFGDCHYKQTKGVAMGTKMGPSFACLFMGHLEEQIFQLFSGRIPELYERFIDDCFGTASCPLSVLNEFMDFVANFHPAIKFTSEVSSTSLPFLDIKVSINAESRFISTSVYYKPTDSHTYLCYASSHPKSSKNSIPYSQFLRLRRLCSSDTDFDNQAKKMSGFFTDQGYPFSVVSNSLQRAKTVSRSDTLNPERRKNKSQNERPVLSLTYHPHNIPVKNILIKNFHILQSDSDLKEIFPSPPLVAYKRDTNLGDHLVHSRLLSSPGNDTTPGTHPCGLPGCKLCGIVSSATFIRGPKGNFTVRRRFTCQSVDVVYAVICSLCSDATLMMYVGETYRSLADRGDEHLRSARLGYKNPVGEHFQQPGHCSAHLSICAVWQCADARLRRKFAEMRLAHKLGTFRPFGMNIRSQ